MRYFGAAYRNIRTKNRVVPKYLTNFILRRLVLVCTGIFIQNSDYMVVQWIIVMLLTIVFPQITVLKL